jgi:hypothetical protein
LHRAAHGVELLAGVQVLGERVQVDRLVLVLERDHRVEELLVGRMIEVGGLELGENRVDRLIVEHQPRENGLLDVQVVGKHAASDLRRRTVTLSRRPRHGTPPSGKRRDRFYITPRR